MIRTSLYALSLAIVASSASATEYRCQVEQKIYWGKEYTPRQIAAGQFSNIVEETKQGAFVSRCSYEQSAARVTCDRYKADRVVLDDYAHIKKFYFFELQFDSQSCPRSRLC
jgi:hypothetical protein